MTRPSFYEESKKHQRIRITPTAWQGLTLFAESLDVSVSELLERIGRGAIAEPDYRGFLKNLKKGLTD